MPVVTLLPFTATLNRKSANTTSFRLSEKFILLLVFSAFITLCIGVLFFLPSSSKLFSGVFLRSSSLETATKTGTDRDSGVSTGNTDKTVKTRDTHDELLMEAQGMLHKHPEDVKKDIKTEKNKVVQGLVKGWKGKNLPYIEYVRPPGATGQEPSDPDMKQKRDKIKEVGLCLFS